MFRPVIHTLDEKQPLSPDASTATEWTPNFDINPNFAQLRGVVHLFRTISRHPRLHLLLHHATSSSPSPSHTSDSNFLLIVAVPSYFSSLELVRFLGSYIDYMSQLLLIRKDAMEDRYSTEVCHLLPIHSLHYTVDEKSANLSPEGYTELPTCPVCLERLDQDTSGIQSTLCDHSFQCTCISKWTHLSCQVCRYCQQQNEKPPCVDCKTLEDIWVCVLCGFVGCGRYKEGHAFRHWQETEHCYSLHLETQRVWDYAGDTYVHRLNQSKTDGKLTGKSICCTSKEGDSGNCGYQEDSGFSSILHSSKVDATTDDDPDDDPDDPDVLTSDILSFSTVPNRRDPAPRVSSVPNESFTDLASSIAHHSFRFGFIDRSPQF